MDLTVKNYACNHGDQEHTNTLCKVVSKMHGLQNLGIQEHLEYR